MKVESTLYRTPGLVSIIMPVYNAVDFIDSTIASVMKQSYENWQLIIVDDCSADGTASYIEENYGYLGAKLIVLSLNENSGPAIARNRALSISSGQYIAFLDSDDLWFEKKLESQINFMKSNSIDFSFTNFNKVDESGSVIGFVNLNLENNRVSYSDLLKTNVIQCSTVIYDSISLGTVNMPSIRRRQDFGLWLKILKKTEFSYLLPECLTSYRVRSDSLSSNKLISVHYTWKIYREVERLPFYLSLWFFSNYLIRTTTKYYKSTKSKDLK